MSTQGASRIAGGIALVAVLSVVAIVTWSLLHQSEPTPSAPVADGPALGDLTGYVGRVDRNARTVDVSENLLGLRPVTMAVTDDTSIVVGGKQGGLGDLTKDMPVRAYYEVRNEVKYVTSIQVVTDDAQATVAMPTSPDTTPAVAAKPPTEARPVTPPPVASAPPVSRPVAPPAAVMSVTPRATPPSPARVVPPRSTDPAPASHETATRPAPAPALAPAPTAEAASPASPPAAAARPADSDAGDGSAAIDWLLTESRRR